MVLCIPSGRCMAVTYTTIVSRYVERYDWVSQCDNGYLERNVFVDFDPALASEGGVVVELIQVAITLLESRPRIRSLVELERKQCAADRICQRSRISK